MPCRRNNNHFLGGCNCCQHCVEFEASGDACERCCKCLPSEFCVTFTPDDPAVSPTITRLDYAGGGLYDEATSVFGDLTVTFDGNTCEWTVDSTNLGIDETYPVRGEGGIGCRSPDFPAIAGTHNSQSGQLTIGAFPTFIIPAVPAEDGCYAPLCDTCQCLCGRLCVLYSPHASQELRDTEVNYEWDAAEMAWVPEFDDFPLIYLDVDESGNCIPAADGWTFFEDEETFPFDCGKDLHFEMEHDYTGDFLIAECAACFCDPCQPCGGVLLPEKILATSDNCLYGGPTQEMLLTFTPGAHPLNAGGAWIGILNDYELILSCEQNEQNEPVFKLYVICDGFPIGTFDVAIEICEPLLFSASVTGGDTPYTFCHCGQASVTWEFTDGR